MMVLRTNPVLRGGLAALAAAGALAAASAPAKAQYYVEGYAYDEPRPRGRAYAIEEYDDIPAMRPPRTVGVVVGPRALGLASVDRVVRTRGAQVIDGRRRDGARVRLIVDTRSGEVVDRIVLEAPRLAPAPRTRVARVEPRSVERPAMRLVPQPPERPDSLKPPVEASAPATVVPPTPAVPTPSATPAPELVAPSIAAPAAPTETPALTAASEPEIALPPIEMPPLRLDDIAPAPAGEKPTDPTAP